MEKINFNELLELPEHQILFIKLKEESKPFYGFVWEAGGVQPTSANKLSNASASFSIIITNFERYLRQDSDLDFESLILFKEEIADIQIIDKSEIFSP